jgi:hypothetical protein
MAFVPAGVEVRFNIEAGGFVIIPATSVSANFGEVEVVDVTNTTTPLGEKQLVSTADLKSVGTLTVTANKPKSFTYAPYRGVRGTLVLSSSVQGWSVSYSVIVVSTTEAHETGGLGKATINFQIYH